MVVRREAIENTSPNSRKVRSKMLTLVIMINLHKCQKAKEQNKMLPKSPSVAYLFDSYSSDVNE
jgi:hypothetical protein